jgi:dTDP-4-dehydrorhamnose 3,5-epimerase
MNKTTAKIQGLLIKPLVRFTDERGDFREILRKTDKEFPGFGQVSSSVVFEGVAKAWHLHNAQSESMTVAWGIAKFAFSDQRKGSPTKGVVEDFLVDSSVNPLLFTVPPGIAHGYRIIHGPAVIIYLASTIYDPKDQIKIAHDDPSINYAWGPPEIK